MKNILIFGAGSIGNHMSFAATKLGFKVYITDINPLALKKMKKEIYPKRYGKWNHKILQVDFSKIKEIKKTFDLIIIGTPPKSHIKMLKSCLNNLQFRNILIEKPLHVYNQKFPSLKKKKNYQIFCGYNHSLSPSFQYFMTEFSKLIKEVISIEVKWKEGWSGILGAHFWMKNEFDSYLGETKYGGGALHEHSHGLHLLLLILKEMKINFFKLKLLKNVHYKKYKSKKYDIFSSFSSFEKNMLIKYETDLLTYPSQKEIIINSKNSCLRWICNVKTGLDMVIKTKKKSNIVKKFKKTRSSEFENELNYILKYNKNNILSNLNIKNSTNVMKFIKRII